MKRKRHFAIHLLTDALAATGLGLEHGHEPAHGRGHGDEHGHGVSPCGSRYPPSLLTNDRLNDWAAAVSVALSALFASASWLDDSITSASD